MTAIARPYAVAAFEYASTARDLAGWEVMLDTASLIVKDPMVKQLLLNPKVTLDQLKSLFCDTLGSLLDDGKRHFIWLLVDNHRLAVLPDIAAMFKEALAAERKTLVAKVTSATQLNDAYQASLSKALTKRFDRQVELHYNVDPALLGGVIVRAGDMVIDGSVRGKLTRLLESF